MNYIIFDLEWNQSPVETAVVTEPLLLEGEIIEIQGTAEGAPFDRQRLDELVDLAEHGLKQIFTIQRAALEAKK